MKEFLLILRRFLPPYKKYLVLSIIFNILSAVLNIFSVGRYLDVGWFVNRWSASNRFLLVRK